VFELVIEKIKIQTSPGICHIPAELIKAGGRIIRSDNRKLISPIWNKKELPEEWKESIIVPLYKKDDKTDCSNNRSISFLSTTCRIFPIILLPR
jgi:hypothetical protein